MFFIYFSVLLVVKGDLRIFLYSLPYSHLTIPSRYLQNTHLTQRYVFRKSFVRSLFFQKNGFLTIHSSFQIAFYTDSTSFYAILQHPAVKLRKGLLAFMQSCVVWFCCCWQCAFFLSSSSHHYLISQNVQNFSFSYIYSWQCYISDMWTTYIYLHYMKEK